MVDGTDRNSAALRSVCRAGAGGSIDEDRDFLYGVRDLRSACGDHELRKRIDSGELKVRQKDGCLYLYKRRGGEK